jgi:gamma-glutamyl-gamma-aminobutyrate hydrolase PuuD
MIGITCGLLGAGQVPRYGVNRKYVDAIQAAGADAVLLPPRTSTAVLGLVDGLLLPGGGDVGPARYGAPIDPRTAGIDTARDQTEVELLQLAAERGLPVLGICRGMQVINVGAGGTLTQHVDGHREEVRDRLAHSVRIEPGGSFGGLALDSIDVNSIHHQAVMNVGRDLKVTAISPDGVIEGLESVDGRVVAVQCHPEELTAHDWASELFRLFVERVVGARQTALR